MISPVGPNLAASSPKASFTRSTGFHLPAQSTAPAASQINAASPASLSGLLALQEYDPDRPRRALRRGQAMLAKLSRLQLAILSTQEDATTLTELADLAAAPAEADDPRLDALLAQVRMRAKIELAKRAP
jgi:hypothetical protein